MVHSLITWGDAYCAANGPRRVFVHTACTPLDAAGSCPSCNVTPGVRDLTVLPDPGLAGEEMKDPVTAALTASHRLLEPLYPGPNGPVVTPAR